MIILFHGSGATDFEIIPPPMPEDLWANLRASACRLLRARQDELAADLLSSAPFQLFEATNFFNDEFSVLYADVSLEEYVQFGEQYENRSYRGAYGRIANVLREIGPYVRLVAVELDTSQNQQHVPQPRLRTTSEAVERALADAERLIHTTGASAGVDRVHTAFHGYLFALCQSHNMHVAADAGIVQLFRDLTQGLSTLAPDGPRAEDIQRVLRALATIIDALNPVRNRASGAHPNPEVLAEPEAMLVVNTVRTLLAYLDQKTHQVV